MIVFKFGVLNFSIISTLNKHFAYRSIDHYGPNPGSQATFYGSQKITVLIWPVCFSKGLSTLHI